MRVRDWYIKEAREMTDVVRGKTIANCRVTDCVLAIDFSDGDSLRIVYERFSSWGLLAASSQRGLEKDIRRVETYIAEHGRTEGNVSWQEARDSFFAIMHELDRRKEKK